MPSVDHQTDLILKCEDSLKLHEFIEYIKTRHPLISELSAIRAVRGWSEQHFLAICVVLLVDAQKKPTDVQLSPKA